MAIALHFPIQGHSHAGELGAARSDQHGGIVLAPSAHVAKLPSFPPTVEVQFYDRFRERHRAMMANDWVAEERALMLLHRPRHTASVGRDELAKRADDFERGKWTELIEGARANVQNHCSSADVVKDDARRGAAAQSREEVRCLAHAMN